MKIFINNFIKKFFKKSIIIIFNLLFYFLKILFSINRAKKKNYYILYEVFLRDFISRSIIAFRLAQNKNNNVLLISFNKFCEVSDILEPGVVLTKGIMRSKEFKDILNRHSFYYLNEEQMGFNYKNKLEMRSIPEDFFLTKIKKFFLWGNAQYQAYKKNKYYKSVFNDKFLITGCPRYDLIQSQNFLKIFNKEVEDIRKNYKKYILVVSNFGYAATDKLKDNNADYNINFNFEQICKLFRVPPTDNFRKSYNKYKVYKIKSAQKYVYMIKMLINKYPDYRIILRPHASDNINFWLKYLPTKNVVFKYSIIPWIIACDVMIHHRCTSAYEAYFLKKKNVISYEPVVNNGYRENNYFVMSHLARNSNQLLNLINKSLLNKNKLYQKSKKLIYENIKKLEKKSSIDKIVKELESSEILKTSNYILYAYLFSSYIIFKTFGFLHKYTIKYKARFAKYNHDINVNFFCKSINDSNFFDKKIKVNKIDDETFFLKCN